MKVADLFDNSYEVAYTADAANGRFFPSLVTYTKAANLTTYRTVEFAYEGRMDTEPNYSQSAYEQTLKRLKWISVRSDVTALDSGTLLRKYRLDYTTGTATGRSQLVAVQEYGSNGNDAACAAIPAPTACALPAQTFTYTAETSGFPRWGTTWGSFGNGQDLGRYQLGDFNGDGKIDVLFIGGDANLYVRLSTGTGFADAVLWGNWGDANPSRYRVADFDGDGKADVLFIGADSKLWVALSNGRGLNTVGPSWSTFGNGMDLARYTFADFDGDGKTDVLFIGSLSDVGVCLSTGSEFAPSVHWIDYANGMDIGRYRFGDFDGDGKTDIAFIGSQSDISVALSTGHSFAPATLWATFGNGMDLARYAFADFNGDGKMDVLFTGSVGDVWVGLSTGSGFAPQAHWTDFGNGMDIGRYRFADFNGDGKTDIAFIGSAGDIWVGPSTGGNFATATQWNPGFGNGMDLARYRLADLDGDGKADAMFIGGEALPTQATLAVVTSLAKDVLLASVQNGIGGTVAVTYAPASMVSGAIVPTSAAPGIANAAPRQLVTSVVTSDGRGGSYTTTYQYYDGRVYPGPIPTRRNLGFGSVTVIDGQTGQYTRTSFNQTPGYEGTISQVEDRTAAGQLIKQKLHTYELVYPVGTTGIELARETQETLRTYELGAFAFSQSTTTSYDDYGNPTVKAQYADGLPTVTVTTTYGILGRVTRLTTTSGGITLGDMINTWTGNTVTSKSEWLGTNNSWRITTMGYDANGNVTSVTEPATGDGLTRSTITDFDGTYKAYVTRVTNALGHMTQSTYDGAGLVRSSTDANGNFVARTYDVFGRVRTESGPGSRYTEWEYRNYGDPNRQCNRVARWVDSTRAVWKEALLNFKWVV